MNALDLAVILAYLAACTALGAGIGARSSGVRDYFLGERNVPAWAVMISIVATETSAVTFLSIPGKGFSGDLTFLQLAMGYILARFVIAIFFLPLYFRGEVETAYQVLQNRFGSATRRAASVLFLVTRTLASGLRLFLAAAVLVELFRRIQGRSAAEGWELPAAIAVIGFLTLIYTYLGGLKAVIWIDVVQFAIYIGAGLVALFVLGREVPGGWSSIVDQAQAAGKLRIFDFDNSLFKVQTFWAGVIGAMVLDTGSHGVEHLMVQRYLSARSQGQAAAALIASGFVVFAQFALFLMIGVGIWALYQAFPPDSPPLKDQEFASFIVRYLPHGILGLVIAAILSVTMSTVSGALTATASSSVSDLYRPLFPDKDDRHLMRVSRVMTAFWGLAQVGVALAAISLQGRVIDNALAIAGFVTGILLGLFLLGMVSKKAGQAAAFVGMACGLVAVALVAFWAQVAYPWYALVGATTVVSVGLLVSMIAGQGRARPPVVEEVA
ncbi:MAG: sodium:solute symporter [Isosphaeraceae bacterium]